MAENQGFLKGVSENLLEIRDFYAKWHSEAFNKKKKVMQYWTVELWLYQLHSFLK